MKILFDALGSTERSGGMRLHSTELVRAWIEQFPGDDVLVISGAWAKMDLAPFGAKVTAWPNEGAIGRAAGQLIASPLLGAIRGVDAVVSLSPIVSPIVPRSRSVCFQHDWRHKRNPHEFPRFQRVYRWLWEWSAANAGVNICISEKTKQETLRFVPSAQVKVVENGRDHAHRWAATRAPVAQPTILTFGHHNNKRPELVIEAFALVRSDLPVNTRLVVLGARGAYANDLYQRSATLGVQSLVDFPGFVSSQEYERLVSSASTIVMASSDEGFGLPVAEAQYFGIPAIVTSDSGMTEIFGDYPFSAEPDASSLGVSLVEALNAPEAVTSKGAASMWRWRDAAQSLRSHLEDH